MSKTDEIIELRKKLLDVEEIVYKLENINNLLTPFAVENSPEGIIIAELFSKQIKTLQEIIKF